MPNGKNHRGKPPVRARRRPNHPGEGPGRADHEAAAKHPDRPVPGYAFNPAVEWWNVDGLTPYPRNARTHSTKQINQIAASIKEFGFTNPVLIDADGGIIAGHGRVEAAKLLGLARVPPSGSIT